MEAWQSRRLDDLEVVYLWADGVYIKAGLEKEKAVILVVIGALSDGRKVVLSVSSGYRESIQSWSEVLRNLKGRVMNPSRLLIADGHLGIWGALRNVFPEADEQRCWNHRIVNLLAKIPKSRHKAALLMLRQIPYTETWQKAERVKGRYQHWCGKRGLGSDGDVLQLPKTAVAPSADYQPSRVSPSLLCDYEPIQLEGSRKWPTHGPSSGRCCGLLRRLRRLKTPHLMQDVYQGTQNVNGAPVNTVTEEKAA